MLKLYPIEFRETELVVVRNVACGIACYYASAFALFPALVPEHR